MNTNIDPYKKLKQEHETLSLIVSAMKSVVSVMPPEQALAQVASHLSESLTLNERTIKWGIDKNIIGEDRKGTSWAQSTKLLEETQETYDAVSLGNLDEIKDGIGDVIISATLLAYMHGLTMDECHEAALLVVEKRTGTMLNGTFVKDAPSNSNK